MTAIRQQRKKKCSVCGNKYQPMNTLQRACSPLCAIDLSRQDQAKKQRRETKLAREKLKTRSDYRKEAQVAFNAFIRERDFYKPCISCGTNNPAETRGGAWDCGHYRSTGANPELRFCETNAAKQCKQCNSYLSGNIVNYRIRLRERIGDAALEWLEGSHNPKKYTKEDLKNIRNDYRTKTRELKQARTESNLDATTHVTHVSLSEFGKTDVSDEWRG